MKRAIAKTLAASAIALAFASAQATEYDWGVHALLPAVETAAAVGGGAVVGGGSFMDTYLFSLFDVVNNEASVAVTINQNFFNISDGSYSLWSTTDYTSSTAGDDLQVGGAWSFDGTTGSTSNFVANLSSGNYYFKVTGAVGEVGGFYLLTSAVTPVPEPEIYAMLAAGLGLMGFVARRRQRSAAV